MILHSTAHKDCEDSNECIFSKVVRAGRRTYFLDVKATNGDDYYVVITESRKITHANGSVAFDRHRLFLYKEDFAKFSECLSEAIGFVREKNPEFFREKAEKEPCEV